MKSPPAGSLMATAAEWGASSNKAPICLPDTERKAEDGFKLGHKGEFIRKNGCVWISGGWHYVACERS